MSDNVFYHHGLTCEADDVLPLLRIEGRRVPVRLADGHWHSPELTGEPPGTLRTLAEKLVEQSAEFEKRARKTTAPANSAGRQSRLESQGEYVSSVRVGVRGHAP
jgi:hypothetical protein